MLSNKYLCSIIKSIITFDIHKTNKNSFGGNQRGLVHVHGIFT